MRPAIVVFLTLILTASGCGSGSSTQDIETGGDSAIVVAPTSTATPTTRPESTTTTSTTSTTTSSSTTTTTTTTLPSTLDIDGSPLIEFSIEVDPALDLDRDELVAFIIETLSDPRSWVSRGAGFRLVDEGGLFTIIVAEPSRVDQLCRPLQTLGRYSCARNGWIAINSVRWEEATEGWTGGIKAYRQYLINHEVGHYIVGPTHSSCPGVGELAPLMMQQTKGLQGCLPNGWVDPG